MLLRFPKRARRGFGHDFRTSLEQLEIRNLLSAGLSTDVIDEPGQSLVGTATSGHTSFAPAQQFLEATAATSETTTRIATITTTAKTGEKPQSKVWQHDGIWWSVLPDASGTWLRQLDGAQWTAILRLATSTSVKADVKVLGNLAHVLLFQGANSSLASLEYDTASQTYQFWSARPDLARITLHSSVETATIDIDSTGRMWLVSDGSNTVEARYSDGSYSEWSSAITIASGISSDDISVVTAMPTGQIGVLWSNQRTKRFGFKTHDDGTDPTVWSADEVPAGFSALNVGKGMADDHLNVAVTSNGTLYAAVKTSYNSKSAPLIALLVRRPNGQWDALYSVENVGTRGIVVVNEAADWLRVIYTKSESGGDIVYRQSSLGTINFGPRQTLIAGSWNDASSTKQTVSDQLVVIASSSKTTTGVLLTGLAESTAPPTQTLLVNAGRDLSISIDVGANLDGTVTHGNLPLSAVSTAWRLVSGPGNVTFGNASAIDTTAQFDQPGVYVLSLSASDGVISRSDLATIAVAPSRPPEVPSTETTRIRFQDGVGPRSSYAGTRDASIRSDRPTSNDGRNSRLIADGDPDYAALIKWDISAVPIGSIVRSASMTLEINDGSKEAYEIYALRRDWSESTVSWMFASLNDPWNSPGAQGEGDYDRTVLGTIDRTRTGKATIELNPQGIAVIQSWVNNPTNNFGFIILDYVSSSDALSFRSRETGVRSDRPRLTVNYELPVEPSPFALSRLFVDDVGAGRSTSASLAAYHGEAGAGSLNMQAQQQATEPTQELNQQENASRDLIFAEGHLETPVATALDLSVVADGFHDLLQIAF